MSLEVTFFFFFLFFVPLLIFCYFSRLATEEQFVRRVEGMVEVEEMGLEEVGEVKMTGVVREERICFCFCFVDCFFLFLFC